MSERDVGRNRLNGYGKGCGVERERKVVRTKDGYEWFSKCESNGLDGG